MRVGVVVPILLEGIRIHLLTAAWVACCVPVSMALAMVAEDRGVNAILSELLCRDGNVCNNRPIACNC